MIVCKTSSCLWKRTCVAAWAAAPASVWWIPRPLPSARTRASPNIGSLLASLSAVRPQLADLWLQITRDHQRPGRVPRRPGDSGQCGRSSPRPLNGRADVWQTFRGARLCFSGSRRGDAPCSRPPVHCPTAQEYGIPPARPDRRGSPAASRPVWQRLKQGCQIDHTRHRSVANFFVNLLADLVAYCLQPTKPSFPVPA